MLNLEFKINPEDWKMVSEDGYPENMSECIALFKMDDGTTHFMIGAYSEENKNFYVNHGWGGMVLEQEDVYAWYPITHDLLKEVNSK